MKESNALRHFLRINKLSGTFSFPDGSTRHYRAGDLHRDDGPAVILPNGIAFWYRNDVLHNDNGPAILTPSGEKFW